MFTCEEVPTLNITPAEGKALVATIVQHTVLVRLQGNADPLGVKELQLHLRYLTSLRPVCVILDFSEVRSVLPSALKALVGFRQALDQAGGDLHIIGLPARVRESFAGSGLTSFFGITKDTEETQWD